MFLYKRVCIRVWRTYNRSLVWHSTTYVLSQCTAHMITYVMHYSYWKWKQLQTFTINVCLNHVSVIWHCSNCNIPCIYHWLNDHVMSRRHDRNLHVLFSSMYQETQLWNALVITLWTFLGTWYGILIHDIKKHYKKRQQRMELCSGWNKWV